MTPYVPADERGTLNDCRSCDYLTHEADECGIAPVCTDTDGDQCRLTPYGEKDAVADLERVAQHHLTPAGSRWDAFHSVRRHLRHLHAATDAARMLLDAPDPEPPYAPEWDGEGVRTESALHVAWQGRKEEKAALRRALDAVDGVE